MAGMVNQEAPWPGLREELRLYPGPAGRGGEPSWTLHDPPAQRFFRLGWLEVEILNRWRLGSAEAIAAAITRETTLRALPAHVEAVRNFLVANSLVSAPAPADVKRLVARWKGRGRSILMFALKNYLFIRIPLVKPDAFLARTVDEVRWLFSRWTGTVLAVLALVGFFFIGRQWDAFRDSFAAMLSWRGGILAAVAIALSKSLHELGHAYAAKALGLRVPSMGISLMCFAPVLWTDTTEAWKLSRRRDRLFIGVSGVYAELFLAAFAALAWPLLPPGALKTAAFITASSTWIMTITVNLNPCMRYDGYYVLSDYWNLPGLQTRSFALAKWWLREWLFGLGRPPPELFEAWDRFKLIVYALFTWVYRFFLFLGIALLVYHLFFKALGAVLMAVELVFFIAMPVGVEIMHWIGLRKAFKFNYRLVRTSVLFLVLAAFFIYPWHNRVEGPAFLFAERQAIFFAPAGALVEAVPVRNGDTVEAGRVLFSLRSPDLDSRIEIAARRTATHRAKLSLASLDMELRSEMAGDWEELERLAEDLGGLLAERQDLEIRAPFAGVVNDIPPWIDVGSWVAVKEMLGGITGGGSLLGAYVSERDWSRLEAGGTGKFYVSGPVWEALEVKVVAIDAQAVTEVIYPELASLMGGPLAVEKDASGRLVPEHAVYRVLCRVEGDTASGRSAVGHVSLEAAPRSLASMVWNNLVGLLVRESGW